MPGKRRKKKPDDIRRNYQEMLAQRCARNAQRGEKMKKNGQKPYVDVRNGNEMVTEMDRK